MAKKQTTGLKKIKTRGGLASKAYNQLKDSIISGKLTPGMRLQEESLTEKMGISRTPFREALNRLNSEGLVDIVPKKGARVAQLTEEDLDDLFEVREIIETQFMKKAIENVKPERFKEIKQQLHDAEQGLNDAQGNFKEWDKKRREYLVIDRTLHDQLITGAGNKYWEQLYLNIRNRIELYGNYLSHDAYWFPVAIKDHHQILDAILDNDIERAQEAMRAHVQNVRQGLTESNLFKAPL